MNVNTEPDGSAWYINDTANFGKIFFEYFLFHEGLQECRSAVRATTMNFPTFRSITNGRTHFVAA